MSWCLDPEDQGLNFDPTTYDFVTLGKTLTIQDTEFLHLQNGYNKHTYAKRSLFKLKYSKKNSITLLI